MGTPTNNYNLQLPTVGGETGTWGTNLNNNTISPLDTILGSVQAVTITSADVSLTNTQFQNAIFNLTGGLTGNRNLFVPVGAVSTSIGAGGRFIVTNNTSNAFSVTVNTTLSGAVGTIVPQGGRSHLYCDGTNVKSGDFGNPGFAAVVSGNPNGLLPGTAGSSAIGMNTQLAYDVTDNTLYACTATGSSATATWVQPTITIARGFDTVANLALVATHTGGNLLSLAIKQAGGTDATSASPIIVPFQTLSGSSFTGAPTTVNITGALSMTTFATGASMGTTNSVPFRVWFALFNNAGTVVPAMGVFSNATTLFPVAEYGVASTTAISGAATTAGVWYTPNGTTLTSKAYRLVGYCEYPSGLATAGTYTSDPTTTVLFGPGIKKPGDTVQTLYATTTTTVNVNTTAKKTLGLTTAITTTSNVNPVLVSAHGYAFGNGNQNTGFRLFRNTGTVAIGAITNIYGNGATNYGGAVACTAFDGASSANWPPTEYNLYGATGQAGGTQNWLDTANGVGGLPAALGTQTGALVAQEIMG